MPVLNGKEVSIFVKREKNGPKCDPESPLRKKLTLYGVTVWVPNWKEEQIVRHLIGQGMTLSQAYGAAGISDLLPPAIIRFRIREFFAASPLTHTQTCAFMLNCLQEYLALSHILVAPAVPLAKPITPTGAPVQPETPAAWLKWIETVTALVPELPPPETALTRRGVSGPAPEWLMWMRTAATLVPHIPTPEPIPPGPYQPMPADRERHAPAVRAPHAAHLPHIPAPPKQAAVPGWLVLSAVIAVAMAAR